MKEIEQTIVYIDVDDTAVPLLPEWVGRYNKKNNDCLDPIQITEWDMTKFIRKNVGEEIYEFLKDPDLYDNLELIDGVFDGVWELRSLGLRCVFLSSGIHIGKLNLLTNKGLIATEKDLIIARDKSLVKGRNNFLIDDGFHNIEAFEGTGILFNAPHNMQYQYDPRAKDWYQAVRIIKQYLGARELFGV